MEVGFWRLMIAFFLLKFAWKNNREEDKFLFPQFRQVHLSSTFPKDCFVREVIKLTSYMDFPEDICISAKVYLKSVEVMRVLWNHVLSIYKHLRSFDSSKVIWYQFFFLISNSEEY
jgi:hypothetical protein